MTRIRIMPKSGYGIDRTLIFKGTRKCFCDLPEDLDGLKHDLGNYTWALLEPMLVP